MVKLGGSLKIGDVLVFDRMIKESVGCNQGIALSPLISVQRNLSANNTKDRLAELAGRIAFRENGVKAFAFSPVMA